MSYYRIAAAAGRRFRSVPFLGAPETYLEKVEVFADLFWRLNETSGTNFNEGVAGTLDFTGPVTLERIGATLAQDDEDGAEGCLGFATHGTTGTTVLTRATNAAFNVTSGGWGCIYQPDDLDDKHVLIARDDGGVGGPGAFSFEVLTSGRLRIWRVDGGGALIDLSSSAGLIVAGTAYHLWFDFGPLGLRAFINGQLVANQAGATTNWATTTTSGIRVGRWYNGVSGADGVMGWLVFRNSQPTAQEIAVLASTQRVRLITGADLGEVPEGSQIVFNVRDYGHYAPGSVTATDGGHSADIEVSIAGEQVTITGLNDDPTGETANIGVNDSVGSIAAATFSIEVTAAASSGEYITTPEAHGWSAGNTNAQNTAAFNAAIDNARANAGSSSTGRGVVELMPGKIYFVRSASNGTTFNWVAALTRNLSNVEIRTQGKPGRSPDSETTNQATIKAESWAGKTGVNYRVLLAVENVNNFKLGWVRLDGNKNSMNNVLTNITYTGENGGMHNIVLDGNVTNFTMKEVDSRMALTDGFQAVIDTGSGLVEDCNFTRNRRQGVTFSGCEPAILDYDQWIFRRCLFNKTGDDPSGVDVVGNQPAAGVDVEPDSTSHQVNGLTFEDCDFDENYSSHYNNGNLQPRHGTPFGLKWDCRSTAQFIKFIGNRFTNQTTQDGTPGIGLDIIFLNTPTFSHWLIEDNVVSGNNRNSWRYWGSRGTAGGTIVDHTLINNNCPSIEFEAGLFDTGHSVTIWKGNFNPSVITNGATTITVNNGFPS